MHIGAVEVVGEDRVEGVPDQSALATSARADDHAHLALRDAQVDAGEHEVVAEALPDTGELDHGLPVRRGGGDVVRT